MERSLEERVDAVLKRAFSLAYEDNPSRTEWPLHPVDADFEIVRPEDNRGDAYYMAEIYLPEYLFDELVGVTEALPAFVDTYLSGKTSLHNLLNVFTPDNLEKKVTHAEQVVTQADNLRAEFRSRQTMYTVNHVELLPV